MEPDDTCFSAASAASSYSCLAIAAEGSRLSNQIGADNLMHMYDTKACTLPATNAALTTWLALAL